jgi:hypothetical protein
VPVKGELGVINADTNTDINTDINRNENIKKVHKTQVRRKQIFKVI